MEPVSSKMPEPPEAKLTPWEILWPLVAGSEKGGIKEGSLRSSPRTSIGFLPLENLPEGPKGKSIP